MRTYIVVICAAFLPSVSCACLKSMNELLIRCLCGRFAHNGVQAQIYAHINIYAHTDYEVKESVCSRLA